MLWQPQSAAGNGGAEGTLSVVDPFLFTNGSLALLSHQRYGAAIESHLTSSV